MTTKKNMVKLALMSALTAGIFGFTACSDDLNELNNVEALNSLDSNKLLNLEQYSYEENFEVNATGPWQIDFNFDDDDHHFVYALPDHGVGNTTVKLCVLDNWTDMRNTGEMMITSTENPASTQVVKHSQKCNLDYQTRGSGDATIYKGNIIFGVGYGYNITKKPGQSAVATSPIIAISKLQANSESGYGRFTKGVEMNTMITTHTGESTDEIARKMEASASVKGSYAGFKAEVGASFTKEETSKVTNRFALGVVDVAVTSAYLKGITPDNVRDYMTADAKKAIDSNGSLDEENFKKVIKNFGTHLLLDTKLGGRLRYATTIDSKYAKTEQELKLWANANYKNKIVQADVKVSGSNKESHQMSSDKGSVRVSAVGGGAAEVLRLSGISNDNDTTVSEWISSMSDIANTVVVDVNFKNKDAVYGIWELVDKNYPERAMALKNYIESGKADYDMNTATETVRTEDIAVVSIPSFDNSQTLVKEAYFRSRPVAMICNEYIPQISTKSRVTVVYPMVNYKPDFENGLFIGNADYAPQYISWNSGNKPEFTSIPGAERGTILNTVFVRENMVVAKEYHAAIVNTFNQVEANIKDKVLEEPNATYDSSWGFKGYPVVKIGNTIWTRGEYQCLYDDSYVNNGVSHYRLAKAGSGYHIPRLSRIASSKDFIKLDSLLSTNRNFYPAHDLYDTGKTGFNAENKGWHELHGEWSGYSGWEGGHVVTKWRCYKKESWCSDSYMWYFTSDKKKVRISNKNGDPDNGKIVIKDHSDENTDNDKWTLYRYAVRLIVEY